MSEKSTLDLIAALPKFQTEWSIHERVKWLQAANIIFDLIYTSSKDDTGVSIEIEIRKENDK